MTRESKSLVGQTIGKWLVVSKTAGRRYGARQKLIVYYSCKCLGCNRLKDVSKESLLDGRTNGCANCNRNVINMLGNVYGDLIVVARDYSKDIKKSGARWICKCKCGNKRTVRGWSLRSGRTKDCGNHPRLKRKTIYKTSRPQLVML